jgi:hypothetical protein
MGSNHEKKFGTRGCSDSGDFRQRSNYGERFWYYIYELSQNLFECEAVYGLWGLIKLGESGLHC